MLSPNGESIPDAVQKIENEIRIKEDRVKDAFATWIKENDPDGAVVLYESKDLKNSFASVDSGKVIKIAEKKQISNHALVGLHYWKRGCDFVKSAQKLIEDFHREGSPECYISESYNYLESKDIRAYHIANHHYTPLGTPEDVARYLGREMEFIESKPRFSEKRGK